MNSVNVYCQEKYLILKNIDIKNSAEPLMPNDVHCDVACLVYDSSHTRSFEYVAKVYLVRVLLTFPSSRMNIFRSILFTNVLFIFSIEILQWKQYSGADDCK